MTKNDVTPRLLDVAGRLFSESGFERTTLREVAAASDLLLGSVQYRYATKTELLIALMERGMRRALERFAEAVGRSADPLERIRLAARAHLRLLVEQEHDVFVLLYEFRSLRGRARARIVRERDAYEAQWNALFTDAVKQGFLRSDLDVPSTRRMLLGALNWTAQWYRPRGALSADAIADQQVRVLIDGAARRSSSGVVARTRRRTIR